MSGPITPQEVIKSIQAAREQGRPPAHRFNDEMHILPRGDRDSQIVFDGILEGFWPFKPERIYIFVDYDIDFNEYRIIAEARFGDWMLPHTIPLGRDDMIDDPNGTMQWLGQKFAEYYRYREFLPNHHEHHLGEE